ncbi:hypothetical protein [Azospirillum sp.]|uniref:hypothetical protein n=1 Tax=Azospirillum sp. TaxID=34012 RepID=UPI002D2599D7|nr:hypothetical protein [Azospirillum sp.]HYD70850.1 hypothetical protein [Azospirillum sp.]
MATTGATSPADVPAFLRALRAPRTDLAATSPQDAPPATAARSGDSVTLSPIAAALKGNALTMFNEALTDDDRRTLDDAVRAGTLTGEDVAKGLTTRLKRIGFGLGTDVIVPQPTSDLATAIKQFEASAVGMHWRGERGSDVGPPPGDAPIAADRITAEKPAAARPPADPKRLAYFNVIDDGGDEAARKIAGLGIDLSPFTAFGERVYRLIDRGAFNYG